MRGHIGPAPRYMRGRRRWTRSSPVEASRVEGFAEWNVRADVVGHAMRLIADGVVDRDGVQGLATRLGYSERHLHRLLWAEVGAGPLALARAQRAQTARVLVETTGAPVLAGRVRRRLRPASASSMTRCGKSRGDADGAAPGCRRRGRHADRRRRRRCRRRSGLAPPRPPALRRRRAAGLPRSPGRRRHRGARRRHLPPDVAPPPSTAVIDLAPRRRPRRAARLRLGRPPRPRAGRPTVRRLLDLDADPVAVGEVLGRDALLAPLVAKRRASAPRDTSTTSWPCGRSSVNRSRPRRAPTRPDSSQAAGTRLDTRRGAHPRLPRTGRGRRADRLYLAMPDRRKTTTRSPQRARRRHHRHRPRGRPGRARRNWSRAPASGRGPRPTSPCAAWAIPTCSCRRPGRAPARRAARRAPGRSPGGGGTGGLWRPWRSYALHHLWATS